MKNEIKDRLSDSDISTVKTDSALKKFTSKITSVAFAVALTLGTAALTTGCNDDCDSDIGDTGSSADPSNTGDACDSD